jgi:hypothetical protein
VKDTRGPSYRGLTTLSITAALNTCGLHGYDDETERDDPDGRRRCDSMRIGPLTARAEAQSRTGNVRGEAGRVMGLHITGARKRMMSHDETVMSRQHAAILHDHAWRG